MRLSLHAFLVLLVAGSILARLLSFFTSLRFLMFVSAMAVPFLTIMPPSATAEKDRKRCINMINT